MPVRFDTAIPLLVEICEGSPDFTSVEQACVVRDLLGRVRLVIDAPDTLDPTNLGALLQERLGRWFNGPVLSARCGTSSERRLAGTILDRATAWPPGWPSTWDDATGARIKIDPRWRGYQRVLSKQAWLDGTASGGAWPLVINEPAIVAFYSFKGGVGRSTLLGVVAWQLAQAGKKVICLDLDLEAPGLTPLFQVQSDESVIDHLLEYAATGRLPANDPVAWASIHGVKIGVVPAGRMGRTYIEKLGRLDYLGMASAAESPVAHALKKLLERIRGQHEPDYIMLDCRAGLHDLGGLSLTDVAHVDVLVGRDTPQGREGLSLTLEVLASRRPAPDQRIVLVQTMVPLHMGQETAGITQSRFRSSMYEACVSTLYADLDEIPAEDDDGVAHFPWPIGIYDEIALNENLSGVSRGMLENDAFTSTRSRVEALAAAEGEQPGPEELDDVQE